jgi:hypothetical protein
MAFKFGALFEMVDSTLSLCVCSKTFRKARIDNSFRHVLVE